MKKRLIILCYFFLLFLICDANFIALQEEKIAAFKKQVRDQILIEAKSNMALNKLELDTALIFVIPVCKIDPEGFTNETFENIKANIAIDETSGYVILKDRKNRVVATAERREKMYFSLTSEKNKRNQPEEKTIDFFCKNYSKNPFYISFTGIDSSRAIGFFKNDSLIFLTKDLYLTDCRQVIIDQIGSTDKFLEIMKLRRTQIGLLKTIATFDEARNVLRKDYVEYMNYLPSDTVKVRRLLLDEIQRSIQITPLQGKLIDRQIIDSKRKHNLVSFTGSGIPYYGKDISQCIQAILTKDQYFKFSEQRELNSWLSSKASNNVYVYFVNNKVSQKLIRSEFIKKIFE